MSPVLELTDRKSNMPIHALYSWAVHGYILGAAKSKLANRTLMGGGGDTVGQQICEQLSLRPRLGSSRKKV